MSLTLHLVRKDLRRLGWWLAGWVGVLLLPIAFGARFLTKEPSFDYHQHEPQTYALLAWLEILAGYLLGLLLLQEDAVVGTEQFWLTRPISRGRWLRAKCLGVFVVLGLVPCLVSLPWWLWCGFGPREIVVAVLEMIAVASLVAIPAALVGTLTENLARAVLWTLVLAAAALATVAVFPVLATAGAESGVRAALLALGVVGLEFVAIIAWVTFTRRRSWSLLWAAPVVPLSAIATFFVSSWWTAQHPGPRELNSARVAAVSLRVERAQANPTPMDKGGRERLQQVTVEFGVEGMPTTHALNPLVGLHAWRLGKITLRHPAWSMHWNLWNGPAAMAVLGLREPGPDEETENFYAAARAKKGLAPWPAPRNSPMVLGYHDYLPRSIVARMAAEPPAYRARLWFQSLRPEIAYEIPLQPGQSTTRAGHSVRIKRRVGGSGELGAAFHLVTVDTGPAPITEMLRRVAEHYSHLRPALDPVFIAVNRKLGEYVTLRVDNSLSLTVNGVRITWSFRDLAPGQVRRGDKWVQRSGWADGATFALLRFNEEARFVREVNVEKLIVQKFRPLGDEVP